MVPDTKQVVSKYQQLLLFHSSRLSLSTNLFMLSIQRFTITADPGDCYCLDFAFLKTEVQRFPDRCLPTSQAAPHLGSRGFSINQTTSATRMASAGFVCPREPSCFYLRPKERMRKLCVVRDHPQIPLDSPVGPARQMCLQHLVYQHSPSGVSQVAQL